MEGREGDSMGAACRKTGIRKGGGNAMGGKALEKVGKGFREVG